MTFGGVAATSYTVDSATQITAVAPAGVGAVAVSVTTIGGTTSAPGTYTYIPAPGVSGLAPTSGPEAGGTPVVITGTDLTGATGVTFGGVAATSYTVDSPTQITAIAPAGVGAVTVSVTTIGGTTSAPGTYTYVPAPTATFLTPTSGPEAGGNERCHHRHQLHRRDGRDLRGDGGCVLRGQLRHSDHGGQPGRHRRGHGHGHDGRRQRDFARNVHVHSAARHLRHDAQLRT